MYDVIDLYDSVSIDRGRDICIRTQNVRSYVEQRSSHVVRWTASIICKMACSVERYGRVDLLSLHYR